MVARRVLMRKTNFELGWVLTDMFDDDFDPRDFIFEDCHVYNVYMRT